MACGAGGEDAECGFWVAGVLRGVGFEMLVLGCLGCWVEDVAAECVGRCSAAC